MAALNVVLLGEKWWRGLNMCSLSESGVPPLPALAVISGVDFKE